MIFAYTPHEGYGTGHVGTIYYDSVGNAFVYENLPAGHGNDLSGTRLTPYQDFVGEYFPAGKDPGWMRYYHPDLSASDVAALQDYMKNNVGGRDYGALWKCTDATDAAFQGALGKYTLPDFGPDVSPAEMWERLTGEKFAPGYTSPIPGVGPETWKLPKEYVGDPFRDWNDYFRKKFDDFKDYGNRKFKDFRDFLEDLGIINPTDPNEKIGPSGYGPERFIGFQSGSLYQVDFENVPTAGAAANRVVVEDQIDPNLDPRTFRLKEIGFGKIVVPVPANRAFFQTRVSLGESMGNILADVSAGVDIATGKIRVVLTAIDPATGEEPEGALLGLLLPNDETGRGQGYVTYTIAPRAGVATGTIVSNLATITFDQEAPLTTNTVTNTVDGVTPNTRVAVLPANSANATFVVSWTGGDDANGSGLQSYDVYVETDGGGYVPWKLSTTDVSGTFEGDYGHTYSFYSVGRDNANNLEDAPESPDTTVVVGPYPRPTLGSAAPNALIVGSPATTISVRGTGFTPRTVAQVNGGARTTTFVSATELKVALTAADLSRAASLSLTTSNPTPGGGASNVLLLNVASAVRMVPTVTLVRDGANVVATVRLANQGLGEAADLAVTTGLLAGRATTTPLPMTVGNVAAGASRDVVLTFAAAGAPGTVTTLRVAGRYTGGTFDATLRITLP